MKKIKVWLITILCLVVIVPVIWILFVYMEGDPPAIGESIPDALGRSQNLSVSVSDPKSGLRKVWVGLLVDDKELVLLEKHFPFSGFLGGKKVRSSEVEVQIEPRSLGISDGKAILRIVATDYSWRRWWHGNRITLEKEILIDTSPPEIDVLTRFHNINQGGSGLIIYKVSETCNKTGVQVGDNFFPGYSGYFEDPNKYLAFFALGYSQDTKTALFLNAVDSAGNVAKTGFYSYLKRKSFKKDIINLSDDFLGWKMPEFGVEAPKDSENPLLDQFLIVNRDLRSAAEAKVMEVVQKSDPQIYWKDVFLRLPNSSTKAGFADHREYHYKNRVIDNQVHLGIDLASLAKSQIPAANGGKIIFADDISIYGKTVFIDHGFGLMSMYSHLSSFSVKVGQMVEKGGIIGTTGITGLAGGDHLHFAMIVHNTFVNPIEWWDSSWITNNVTDKLKAASSG